MLDVGLRGVGFRYRGGFALRELTVTFARSTHTAIVGLPGCGASTLLRLIAGELRVDHGEIVIGQRRVDDLRPARRPLLYVTSKSPGAPPRWSVQHALVAAVRRRTLDLEDRRHEYELAAERWDLTRLLERRISTLSSSEAARVSFARIELLRPAILVADRILETVNPSARSSMADALYRLLRVIGCTVIAAPASRGELAFMDRVVVLEAGTLSRSGSPAEVFRAPGSHAAAVASGEADAIPVTIRGGEVTSPIGVWTLDPPPFQGDGVALVRPDDFSVARPGEESDLVFGVEEAGFDSGRWIAHGLVTGGVSLRVALDRDELVHKGRLLALKFDPRRFTLVPEAREPSSPAGGIPPLRETR